MTKIKDIKVFQISECEGLDIILEDGRTVTLYFERAGDKFELYDIKYNSNEISFEFLQECMAGALQFMMGKIGMTKPPIDVEQLPLPIAEEYGWECK